MTLPFTSSNRRARAAAALLLTGIAGHAQADGVAVAIEKFAFAPGEVTVAPGTTVTWTNRDETPHTVNARDSSFASKAMDTGDRYEYTFAHAGDFAYFCTLHPFMIGVVHVRDAAPPPR